MRFVYLFLKIHPIKFLAYTVNEIKIGGIPIWNLTAMRFRAFFLLMIHS